MNLSYNLLCSLLPGKTKPSVEELTEHLTMLGFEVESVTKYEEKYRNVVVGLVTETRQHPKADRLKICSVSIGTKNLQIVCGATNVRQGIKVPVSLVGATLPNGVTIEKASLRGVESHGMICSSEELDLKKVKSSEMSIMELDNSAKEGSTFASEYFSSDTAIDISITPNRGDCTGTLGIVREICAILNKENSAKAFWEEVVLSEAGLGEAKNNKFSHLTEPAQQKIAQQLQQINGHMEPRCKINGSLYCAKVLGTQVKPSSKKICQLLNALDIKRHNNIVDVSNYVSAITGIPVHIYDADKLNGDLELTFAEEGETFTCINETEEKLSSKTLIIRDAEKTVSIFGAMGSNNSSVSQGTKNIVIECGYAKPALAMVGYYGVKAKSEARYRTERGTDFGKTQKNLIFTINTILEECGGRVVSIGGINNQEKGQEEIKYPLGNYKRVTGIDIEEGRAMQILNQLEFKPATLNKNKDSSGIITVKIPTHRHDVLIKEDITEELIRLQDVNSIPIQPIYIESSKKQDESYLEAHKIVEYLTTIGYQETIHYSFIEKELLSKFVKSVNPDLGLITPMNQLDTIQQSGIPNLLKSLSYNLDQHKHKSISMCELTTIFQSCSEGSAVISGIRYGNKQILSCNEPTDPFSVFTIKKDLCECLYYNYRYSQTQLDAGTQPASQEEVPFGHPYRRYKIEVDGKCVCYFGQVHPSIMLEIFGIKSDVLFFQINCDNLKVQYAEKEKVSINISESREMSFVVDKSVLCSSVISLIRNSLPQIGRIAIREVFESQKEFGEGRKSIHVSFSLGNNSKTPEQKEEMFSSALREINKKMSEVFSATLRGQL